MRVLAVDDDAHSLRLLHLQLRGHGMDVVEARDGADALEQTASCAPDVIISDLLMPVMDGYTLLRRVRADPRLAQIPFIVHTATYTDARDEQLARDLGADGFLVKPAEPAVLLRAIDAAVSGARARPVPAPAAADDEVLQAYSAVLVAKLEDKAAALEAANRALVAAHARAQALSQRLVRLKEEESTRIAREIHDELGQALTGLKLDVAWLLRRLERAGEADTQAALRERLATMGDAIDATVAATRRICIELRPAVLDDLGLVAAVDWQARQFGERARAAVDVELPDTLPPLDDACATALFRILQELLTNVARHADARRVTVTLHADECRIVLGVTDDGGGLAPGSSTSERTFGLAGVRERAALCGGEVDVRSAPGQGTAVRVTLPLTGAAKGGQA